MKNLIFIFAILFAVNLAAQNTVDVTFYFNPQSSELTVEDLQKFAELSVDHDVVAVKGFANQLPNTTTLQSNVNLAHDRAMNLVYLAPNNNIIVDWTVVHSTSELDRRVEITFVERNETIGNTPSEEVVDYTTNLNDEDYFKAGPQMEFEDEIQFKTVPDSIIEAFHKSISENNGQIKTPYFNIESETIVNDKKGVNLPSFTLPLSKNKKVDKTTLVIIERVDTIIQYDTIVEIQQVSLPLINDNCECSAANLGLIESRWKEAVETAKYYRDLKRDAPLFSEDRKVFKDEQSKAKSNVTNLRKCMETSRYKWKKQQQIQREIHKINTNNQKDVTINLVAPYGATTVSSSIKSTKSTKKNKNIKKKIKSKFKRMLPQPGKNRNGTVRMGLVKRINLFLGWCLGKNR